MSQGLCHLQGPSTALSTPVSSVYADQLWLQKDHSDEIGPPNKSGHILHGNIPNKIRAKPGVLRNVLLTFFLAGKHVQLFINFDTTELSLYKPYIPCQNKNKEEVLVSS